MEKNRRRYGRFFLPALSAGVCVCVVFFAISLYHGPGGNTAPPQPDSLLFQQYARSIAEGHPYRFIPDQPPSTGSTSHLYPALLSVWYLLGASGDALPTAACLFNALCFICFLVLFWHVALRLAPDAAPLAIFLCILSGQSLFSVFAQTETALFMLLTMGALAAALYRRYVLLGIALFLSVLCRPEGVILSVLMLVVSFGKRWKDDQKPVALAAGGIAGVAAFGIVLLVNVLLTGTPVFFSMFGKGLGGQYPLSGMVFSLGEAFGGMTKEILFGLAGGGRQFYVMPVVGGALGILGLAGRSWREGPTSRLESWWLLSGIAALVLVALSGWQGVHFDRYLAWLFPVWFLYIAVGARALSRMFSFRHGYAFLATVLVVYQCIGFLYFSSIFASSCSYTMSNISFCRRVKEMLPPGSRIGVNGKAGVAYYMPEHCVLNINGIVTPAFANRRSVLCNLELLKHRPEYRFDVWLVAAPDAASGVLSPFIGNQIAAQTPVLGSFTALTLHKATWETLDGGSLPLSPHTLEAVQDRELVDSLDVGYLEDEDRCDYSWYTRVPGAKLQLFSATKRLEQRSVTEAGQVIIGYERFRIRTIPGKGVRVVMRTASKVAALIHKPTRHIQSQEFMFVSPLTLLLFVNDQSAGKVQVALSPDPQKFSEVVFDLPAALITSDTSEITVGGDHISFGYWFYQ